ELGLRGGERRDDGEEEAGNEARQGTTHGPLLAGGRPSRCAGRNISAFPSENELSKTTVSAFSKRERPRCGILHCTGGPLESPAIRLRAPLERRRDARAARAAPGRRARARRGAELGSDAEFPGGRAE